MLLQQIEKSTLSENMNVDNKINTQSNRESEINNSPKKSEGVILKPPKEEEKIQLNNKNNTDDGTATKKGCC